MTTDTKISWALQVLQISVGSYNQSMAVKLALEILQSVDEPVTTNKPITTKYIDPKYMVFHHELDLANSGQKIQAIKSYRNRLSDVGLLEAKKVIEYAMKVNHVDFDAKYIIDRVSQDRDFIP